MKTVSYKCPKCGHPHNDVKVADEVTWRFCTTCGERVEFEAPVVAPAAAQTAPASEEARMEYEIRMRELELEKEKMKDEKRARSAKFAFSVVLAVIGIVLLAFGISQFVNWSRDYLVLAIAGAILAVVGIVSAFTGDFKKPRA